MAKVWLIGENNPYGPTPEFVLYPAPKGCTGERLCRALQLGPDVYLETFERRNLLAEVKWSVPKARRAASAIDAEAGTGDALVLLGGRVTAAFGLAFKPLTEQHTKTGLRALIAPHPSGLSRVWNQRGMAEKVREAVMRLVRERMPRVWLKPESDSLSFNQVPFEVAVEKEDDGAWHGFPVSKLALAAPSVWPKLAWKSVSAPTVAA